MRKQFGDGTVKHHFIDVFEKAGSPVQLKPFVIEEPVWPRETLERHTEILNSFMETRHKFKELDSLPRETLERDSFRRLRTLVTYAYENIRHYRHIYSAVGFEPGDLKSLCDFERLPTVDKSDMRAIYEEVSSNPWTTVNFKARTSGSTGSPLSLINDTDRQRHWFVTRMHMFEDMIGQELAPRDWIYSIYYEPFLLTSIFGNFPTFTVGLQADPEQLANHIRKIRPRIVTGVASHVLRVARLLPDSRDLGILAYTTNSETSSNGERLSLGEAIGTPILDEYSSEELGIIAWEQRDGSYVVAEDTVHLELLGRDQEGLSSVVGTDLWNFVMPRIRYRQGDYAEWQSMSPERGLKRLERIVGRQDMMLISPSKGAIDPGRILEIFDTTLVAETAGVEQFRLVQSSMDEVKLLVELGRRSPGYESAIREFHERFAEVFGPKPALKVEVVPELPSLGVKRRCIYRNFNV